MSATAKIGARQTMNPRTLRMLEGNIVPTLLAMAWPTVTVVLAQTSMGFIQVWFISRLGLAALAGYALVYPYSMMMIMLSNGSLGGSISSSIGRALGAGRREEAQALVWHVVVLSFAIGGILGGIVLVFGRPLYSALGGRGDSLEAALVYSGFVFLAAPLTWLSSGLASVLRGTGNMLTPAVVYFISVVALVVLSPPLMFGFGQIPAMGIAGAGIAYLATGIGIVLALGWCLLRGDLPIDLVPPRLKYATFVSILSPGVLASLSALQTSLTVVLLTALVGRTSGPDAVAGYGIGVRLEYLLLPLLFGIGAPIVAMVATNIGAGQRERAVRSALIGGAVSFILCEVIGLAAATWPEAWLGLFSHDPRMMAAGVSYFRYAAPAYGFLGLGVSLFFASQGSGRLYWAILATFVRMGIALAGGWAAWVITYDLRAVFGMLAVAWIVYGSMQVITIRAGVWFKDSV